MYRIFFSRNIWKKTIKKRVCDFSPLLTDLRTSKQFRKFRNNRLISYLFFFFFFSFFFQCNDKRDLIYLDTPFILTSSWGTIYSFLGEGSLKGTFKDTISLPSDPFFARSVLDDRFYLVRCNRSDANQRIFEIRANLARRRKKIRRGMMILLRVKISHKKYLSWRLSMTSLKLTA